MLRNNSNLIVLLDSAGQERRMKHYLKTNGIAVLKKGESNTYPVYYMIKQNENDCYAKYVNSLIWFDVENVKHSLFDADQPYTDVVTLSMFLEKGGWQACSEN